MVARGLLDSLHVLKLKAKVVRTALGDELVTNELPMVAEKHKAHLSEQGVVSVGDTVCEHDVLVGKLSPVDYADSLAGATAGGGDAGGGGGDGDDDGYDDDGGGDAGHDADDSGEADDDGYDADDSGEADDDAVTPADACHADGYASDDDADDDAGGYADHAADDSGEADAADAADDADGYDADDDGADGSGLSVTLANDMGENIRYVKSTSLRVPTGVECASVIDVSFASCEAEAGLNESALSACVKELDLIQRRYARRLGKVAK